MLTTRPPKLLEPPLLQDLFCFVTSSIATSLFRYSLFAGTSGDNCSAQNRDKRNALYLPNLIVCRNL
jgi:hypothetical protein